MKQYNLNGIVERSSAMMEALSIETEMFYRGYHADITAYQYTNGGFHIEVIIFCDNSNEQCFIAQYLENHPARRHGKIKTGAMAVENNYWVKYQIVQ